MASEAPAGVSEINNSGKAKFGPNHYCLWKTEDGPISTCTIQNGGPGILAFTVSGAPPAIVTTGGIPFNGKHKIPSNNPEKFTAIGNFQGTTVTISNVSAPDDTICVVSVTVA